MLVDFDIETKELKANFEAAETIEQRTEKLQELIDLVGKRASDHRYFFDQVKLFAMKSQAFIRTMLKDIQFF